jgi:hypothetical protein
MLLVRVLSPCERMATYLKNLSMDTLLFSETLESTLFNYIDIYIQADMALQTRIPTSTLPT